MYAHDDLLRFATWFANRTGLTPDLKITNVSYPTNGFSAKTVLLDIAAGAVEQSLVVRVQNVNSSIFLDSSIPRQARMMLALGRHAIPVPEVLCWDESGSILDGPLLVMKRCVGEHLPQRPSYHVAGFLHMLDEAGRDRAWRTAITGMARLNRISWREDFNFLMEPSYGRPGLDHYLGWIRAWRGVACRDAHPIIDPAIDHLTRSRPVEAHADLLWGDSNAGNFLFAPSGEVSALLDFEAASIGPGEIDLAWWFFLDAMLAAGQSLPSGMPNRDAQISIYEQALGRRVSNLEYYELLAAVRMSLVIAQTARLLIEAGRLPATNRSSVANPAVSMLASMMGIESETPGADFMAMWDVLSER